MTTIVVRLNGVGWNVRMNSEEELTLNVGFSHPIKVLIPKDVTLKVRSENLLEVKGLNKQLVGDFVASLIRIRPWNPYSGHGIVRMDRADNLSRRRGK